MKKIIFLLVISTFLINPLYSMNLTNKECNDLASEINSSMGGMQIDQTTILQNVLCPSDANLLYSYKITLNISSEVFKEVIPELKTNNINAWCSNPDLIELLNVLDSVGFRYANNINMYIGEYTLDKSYCN